MSNLDKFKDAFARGLNIDVSLVSDSLKYQSIKEWDSVSHMILISEIEETFNISIDTDDVIDMSSFAKARKIVSKYNIDL